MKLLPKVGDYFALDIGTTAIRVVQLSSRGKAWSLEKYGIANVESRYTSSDSPEDQKRLGEVIMTAIGQSGIKARDVVIGIPSNKMFATVVDMPNLSKQELANSIKYQAEQYIPMSLDEAKIDWTPLGKSVNDETKNEVLLASVANTFSENRLDLIEGLGFNVVAMEPDSLALTRSLLSRSDMGAHLIIEIGDFATDVVLTYGDSPRLIRSIPTGMETLVKAATQNLNIQPDQARQFLLKFGVQPDRLEGQVYRAVETSLDQFAAEIIKSVKFFKTRYPSVEMGSMIVSSYGVTIPAIAQYIAQKVDLKVEMGNPWANVQVASADQQKLQSLSAQFSVAIGLAQRGVS